MDQPRNDSFPPQSNDSHPETEILPPVYQQSGYVDDSYQQPEDEFIATLMDYRAENLGADDFVNGWVRVDVYDQLWEQAYESNIAESQISKQYDNIRNSLSLLETDISEYKERAESAEASQKTAQRGVEGREKALEKQQEEFEFQKKKSAVLRYSLMAASVVFLITSITFFVMWNNARDDSESISSSSSAQESRINDLNTTLGAERNAKAALETQKNDLQGRVDDLSSQINEANKNRDELQKKLDDREKELKDLADRIDQIGDQEQATVTVTAPPVTQTMQAPGGDATTIVETHTVTEQAHPTTTR